MNDRLQRLQEIDDLFAQLEAIREDSPNYLGYTRTEIVEMSERLMQLMEQMVAEIMPTAGSA